MSLSPLRAYRERQQPPLSQAELGSMLGFERMTIFRWETGRRKISAELLEDISQKTGIAKAELRPDLAAMFSEPAQ
jgi:transcriptional regulator with XRE-family HTH domain